jgi:arabinofuranosyltransferase
MSFPAGKRRLVPQLIAVLTVLAWARRFIQDDAFITFRYAANLAAGHGLVWNPGQPPVEGYTNFLWAVLLAGPVGWGWDPVVVSQVLGVACFGGALAATAALARRVAPDDDRAAFLAVLLVGGNHSFLSWATGGMATMLQALLVTAGALAAVACLDAARRTPGRLALFSLLAGLACLTRPDSLLPIGIMGLCVLAALLRGPAAAAARVRGVAALLLPALLLLAPYALWKLSFYGSLLPNTFHAKAAQLTSARAGLRYVLEFLASYGWLPVVFLAVAAARGQRPRGGAMLLAVVAAWLVYLVRIGGGFMEFRLMVAVLPVAGVLMVAALGAPGLVRWRPAVVAGLVAASLLHGQLFSFRSGIESVNDLGSHLAEARWDEVGRALGRHFGGVQPTVVLATTAAGAVPYHAGLPAVDMLGLNDPDIARHGAVLGHHPGHKRVATARQLLERGVHLVVGHPQVQGRDDPVPAFTADNAGFAMAGLTADLLPDGARVFAMPLPDGRVVLVLRFLPHPGVDAVIDAAGWRTWPVAREGG